MHLAALRRRSEVGVGQSNTIAQVAQDKDFQKVRIVIKNEAFQGKLYYILTALLIPLDSDMPSQDDYSVLEQLVNAYFHPDWPDDHDSETRPT